MSITYAHNFNLRWSIVCGYVKRVIEFKRKYTCTTFVQVKSSFLVVPCNDFCRSLSEFIINKGKLVEINYKHDKDLNCGSMANFQCAIWKTVNNHQRYPGILFPFTVKESCIVDYVRGLLFLEISCPLNQNTKLSFVYQSIIFEFFRTLKISVFIEEIIMHVGCSILHEAKPSKYRPFCRLIIIWDNQIVVTGLKICSFQYLLSVYDKIWPSSNICLKQADLLLSEGNQCVSNYHLSKGSTTKTVAEMVC